MPEEICLIKRNNDVIRNLKAPGNKDVTDVAQKHISCFNCEYQCIRELHKNMAGKTVKITIQGLGGICNEGVKEDY